MMLHNFVISSVPRNLNGYMKKSIFASFRKKMTEGVGSRSRSRSRESGVGVGVGPLENQGVGVGVGVGPFQNQGVGVGVAPFEN